MEILVLSVSSQFTLLEAIIVYLSTLALILVVQVVVMAKKFTPYQGVCHRKPVPM